MIAIVQPSTSSLGTTAVPRPTAANLRNGQADQSQVQGDLDDYMVRYAANQLFIWMRAWYQREDAIFRSAWARLQRST